VKWIVVVGLVGCAGAGATPAETDTGTTPPDTATVQHDADGDGFDAGTDCDDTDDTVYPGAPDICGDDRSTDCDRTSDDGLVTVDAADTFTDLQDALDVARPGATVLVCPGTHTGPFVGGAVRLVSHAGAAVTILDGNLAGSTLQIAGDSEVIGLTITGGRQAIPYRGGGIDVASSGTLLVEDCVITGNSASAGGGLYLPTGTAATVRATLVEGNTVEPNDDGVVDAGAGIFAEEDVVLDLTGTTITGNSSYGFFIRSGVVTGGVVTDNRGTGIWVLAEGPLELIGTEISHNDGVGLLVSYGSSATPVALTDIPISSNADGGMSVSGAHLTMLGTTEIVDNTAVSGGGVTLRAGASLTGGTIAGNTATGSGGGVRIAFGGYDDATLQDVVIEGNVATDGAGVSFGTDSAQVTFVGGRISGNTATGRGGAFDLPDAGFYSPRIVFSGVEITDNTAGVGGGLYLAGGTLTIEQCTVARNVASEGGGAFVSGQADFASVATSWGLGVDANTPGDVYASGELGGYGASATFSCTAAGCDPAP
jgi:hypothetical protein